MASLSVLTFDREGRPIQFDTSLDDLQLYLLSDSRDSILLFDHTSGASLAPPATADSATRSQWFSRDAAARLAVHNHLPLAERAHFGQHKTPKALYDDVVARYSSPPTVALGHLILPYLFPELSAFATAEDLVTHLRTSDARYRSALPAEFLDGNPLPPPPMYITLYFIVTCLPDSLLSVRDHFLALDPTALTIDLLEKHLLVAETSEVTDVWAASALSGKRRSNKGKSGKSGGGGSGGGGGVGIGGGGDGGGGGSGGSGGFGGSGGGSGGGGGGGGGSSGSGGCSSGGGRGGAVQRGGSGGGQRQQQRGRSETPTPQQLREWFAQHGASGGSVRCPYVIRTGDRAGQTCGKLHTQHRCFSRLDDAWRAEFEDEAERPHWAGIEAAALCASESALPGTAPAKALHTFTLDSGASHCFFHDSTTLTPLPAPVPVRLADPLGGPFLARSSTVLPSRVSGQSHERYFLLVVDDYTRYTTVFPLRSKGEVPDVLIPWIRTVRLQIRERFRKDLPVLRLHSDRGGEFSSDLLRDFCRREGILQSFTLPTSPQENGIAKRRIGLVMEVARTSMIHAAAPHFQWPFAVGYATHQLNLWPCVSFPETSPTLRWTGKVGDAPVFRVWGSRAFVRDTSVDKLSSRAIPCDVTFDKSVPFYRLFPYRTAPLPPPPLFLASGPPPVDPLPPQGPAPSGVSQVDPLSGTVPVKVAVDSGAARGAASRGAASGGAEPARAEPEGAEPAGAESEGAESGGVEPGGAGLGGTEPKGAEPGGAESEGAESGGAEPRGTTSAGGPTGSAAGGTGAGGTGATSLGGAGAAGLGGARARGTGAAGGGGVGGTGAGEPVAGDPGAGGAGARGDGARDTGAGGPGDGSTGAGHPGAGGAGVGGAGAGSTGIGGTVQRRPFFVPPQPSSLPPPKSVLLQVLSLPSSTGLTPPLLCPPHDQSQPQLQPDSPLPAPSPYAEQTDSPSKHREPASRPALPVCAVRTGRRVPRPRPPPVPGTHVMALRPSSVPLQFPLPPPPESSLPVVPDPESDLAHAASPAIPRLLATVVTDPSFESTAASALVAELVDFAAACRIDYATSLVAESDSDCPPSVGGECALGTDVLENRHEDFECLAAAVLHLVAMLRETRMHQTS
ncbi:unnamed protein product [Closterium sp. NIES-54]